MNKTINKEELLKGAREIVDEQGLEKLNIRCLAQRCNISIGSVYNYFPSKADLIFSLVEDFWKTIFRPEDFSLNNANSFIVFIDELYNSFAKQIKNFKLVYTGYLTLMKSADKDAGKQIEHKYLDMVQKCIREALEIDNSINSCIWTDTFTKDVFSNFVFDNMFFMLVRGKKDCEYLKKIIEKILY